MALSEFGVWRRKVEGGLAEIGYCVAEMYASPALCTEGHGFDSRPSSLRDSSLSNSYEDMEKDVL